MSRRAGLRPAAFRVARCGLASLVVLACAWFSVAACGDQVELGVETGAGLEAGPCEVAKCLQLTHQCGDCHDNDVDGLVDADDPDCLGSCDNTEDSYYGGISGQNNAPCVQDCYFDQDTGAGNDQCYWSHECDSLSVVPSFPPSGDERCAFNPDVSIRGTDRDLGCDELAQVQSPRCREYCGPLTPNGCDCFGCCNLPAGSAQFVWLGSTEGGVGTCQRGTISDAASCHPCSPVLSCFNGCENCELCVDKDAPGPSCPPSDPNVPGQCPTGRQACGLKGQGPCPSGQYCVTGCCVTVPA